MRDMPEQHTLTFKNSEARPRVQQVKCDAASVPLIMQWYGAFFAGDEYEVRLDGLKIKIDRNGEPIDLADVLKKLEEE